MFSQEDSEDKEDKEVMVAEEEGGKYEGSGWEWGGREGEGRGKAAAMRNNGSQGINDCLHGRRAADGAGAAGGGGVGGGGGEGSEREDRQRLQRLERACTWRECGGRQWRDQVLSDKVLAVVSGALHVMSEGGGGAGEEGRRGPGGQGVGGAEGEGTACMFARRDWEGTRGRWALRQQPRVVLALTRAAALREVLHLAACHPSPEPSALRCSPSSLPTLLPSARSITP